MEVATLALARLLAPARKKGNLRFEVYKVQVGLTKATYEVKLTNCAEPEIFKLKVTSATMSAGPYLAHRHLRTLAQSRFALFKLKSAGNRTRRTVQADLPTSQDNLGLLAIGPGAPSRSFAD